TGPPTSEHAAATVEGCANGVIIPHFPASVQPLSISQYPELHNVPKRGAERSRPHKEPCRPSKHGRLDPRMRPRRADPTPKATYTVGINEVLSCVAKAPAKMECRRVFKSSVSPSPPGGGSIVDLNVAKFLCYKIKCPTVLSGT